MSLLKQGRWTYALLGLVFLFSLVALAYRVPKKAYEKILPIKAASQKKSLQDDTGKRKYEYKQSVKGIKVVEIRNLQSDNWAEDLEIEIKNTSEKPIYYIRLVLTLNEIKLPPNYYPLGFIIKYGNDRHINVGSLAEADEPSIKPGENYVLKIPMDQIEGWKRKQAEYNPPPVTRVELYFNVINYGDGTGYLGEKPQSNPPKKRSSNTSPPSQVVSRSSSLGISLLDAGKLLRAKNRTSYNIAYNLNLGLRNTLIDGVTNFLSNSFFCLIGSLRLLYLLWL